MRTQKAHFDSSHPLAEVAARHCKWHFSPRIGGVACGKCWERAIRDDERFAVEHDLPREITPDPEHVDEIAVDLACLGERVKLTPIELSLAAQRLRRLGLSSIEIGRRLHVSYHATVNALTRSTPVKPSSGLKNVTAFSKAA